MAVVTLSIGVTFMFRMSSSTSPTTCGRARRSSRPTLRRPSTRSRSRWPGAPGWISSGGRRSCWPWCIGRAAGRGGRVPRSTRRRRLLVPLARVPGTRRVGTAERRAHLGRLRRVLLQRRHATPDDGVSTLHRHALDPGGSTDASSTALDPSGADGRVGERARELPARCRPDRSRVGRGPARPCGDEARDPRGGCTGPDRHRGRPVRGGRVAVRGRHLHQPKDPGTYPGMGGDDHPLGRRSALLHLGARRRGVPRASGDEDRRRRPPLARIVLPPGPQRGEGRGVVGVRLPGGRGRTRRREAAVARRRTREPDAEPAGGGRAARVRRRRRRRGSATASTRPAERPR